MKTIHDSFAALPHRTPFWFSLAARALPVGLLVQFLSAGIALFSNAEMWGLHAAAGGALFLPVAALLLGSLLVQRLSGFRWWSGLISILYLTQLVLAAGSEPFQLSLHPFNGALLLTASLILLAKVERRAANLSSPANHARSSTISETSRIPM